MCKQRPLHFTHSQAISMDYNLDVDFKTTMVPQWAT